MLFQSPSVHFEKIYRSALPSLTDTRPQAMALCPFHEDRTPSLSVNLDNGLYQCFGCKASGNAWKFYAEMKRMGKPISFAADEEPAPIATDSAPVATTEASGPRRIIRSHRWTDEQGRVAFKHRFEPKSFMWTEDAEGKKLGKGACTPTLYDLEAVKEAECVVITEGERDVDTDNALLQQLNVADHVHATCTPNGAGDVKPEMLERLHGKAIVWVSGDNDEAGVKYRESMKAHLRGKVRELRTLVVPAPYKDWTEWAEAGGTPTEFRELLRAAPILEPVNAPTMANTPGVPAVAPPTPLAWCPPDLAEGFLNDRGYRTELGIGLRKYQGEWYRFDGKIYRPLKVDSLRAHITKYLHKTPVRNKTTDRLIRDIIQNLEAHCLVDATGDLPMLESDGTWIEQPRTMVVQNGILHLNLTADGAPVTLLPHTPQLMSTVILPYAYDAAAQCREWIKFLEQIFPDHDSQVLLQEMFGYCLTPGNLYQKFFMLEGSGGNGKGVVTNILTRLLHRNNVSNLPLNKFNSTHELFVMHGKLLNLSTELKQADRVAEDRVKEITGGDAVHYNPKYREGFAAKATYKVILSTNERPSFMDRSDGLWRRLIILPFPMTIPPECQNPHLEEQLAEELPGIFNWALRGAVRLHTLGKFTVPDVSRQAHEEFRLQANHPLAWLTEHYEVNPDGRVDRSLIYSEYVSDCKEGGFHPLNRTNFYKEVERIFPAVRDRAPQVKGQPRPQLFKGIQKRNV